MPPTHQPTSAARVPRFPERVGSYEILLPIASGGMATVYLARARGAGGFERDVALKLTHAHLRKNDEFARHLIDEAKLASGIRHPNVVPVLDVGDDPLGIFLVMEYVEGDTLANLERLSLKRGGRLPVPIGMRVLVDALAGLHAAHELRDPSGQSAHLVHRDFSPQNILARSDGITQLTDFGVAKAATRLSQTATGIVKGKIAYMAPEHARGRTLDRRADVFSAGVIAWEILAGRRLHDNDNDLAAILRVASEQPPPLGAVASDVPPQLEQIVSYALAMHREERCPSAAELGRRLEIACMESGRLATTDEVSAFVREVVGLKLAERRERVREVVALRSRMGEIAASETTAVVTPSFESPLLEDPTQSTLTVPGEQHPEMPTDVDVTAVASAPTPLPDSGAFRRPLVSMPASDEGTGTDSVAVSAKHPAPARSRLGIAMAAGAAVALLVVVPLTFLSVFHRSAPIPIVSPPSSTSEPPAPAPEPVASPTTGEAFSPAPAVSERTTQIVPVTLTANAEIQGVRIGSHALPVDRPHRNVTVTLTGEEAATTSTLVVTSLDGRTATVIVEPGTARVQVYFTPKATKTPPHSTTAKPTAPLATNPYAR